MLALGVACMGPATLSTGAVEQSPALIQEVPCSAGRADVPSRLPQKGAQEVPGTAVQGLAISTTRPTEATGARKPGAVSGEASSQLSWSTLAVGEGPGHLSQQGLCSSGLPWSSSSLLLLEPG